MKTQEEKYIKITITEKDGVKTRYFKSEGFNDYEVVGLLAHYKDKIQIEMLNKTNIKNENT